MHAQHHAHAYADCYLVDLILMQQEKHLARYIASFHGLGTRLVVII